MPHINLITTGDAAVLAIWHNTVNKRLKRQKLVEILVSYDIPVTAHMVAIVPRILSPDEILLSDNMLPLELKIEFSTPSSGSNVDWQTKLASTAHEMRDSLLRVIGGLEEITFGVWMIYGVGSSFAEHNMHPE